MATARMPNLPSRRPDRESSESGSPESRCVVYPFSVTVNVLPTPGSLSTVASPP